MAIFSKSDFQRLNEVTSSHCVSIFIPTHEKGAEIQQDPIRLKNQISEAIAQLGDRGIDEKTANDLLKPAIELVDQYDFWQHQSAGLALFIGEGEFHSYRVPTAFETKTVVANSFALSPMMHLMQRDGQFYILSASQNNVALYLASQSSVIPIDLGDTPLSLEVALRYDDPEESLQGHTGAKVGSSVAGGSGQQVFHGQGGGHDTHNTDILRFFQLVSDGVEDVIAGQSIPLVFVGVDFLFPIYQQANKYPHLLEEAVAHQPDQLSPEEIRDRAWEIVKPILAQDKENALEQYGSLKNNAQATEDLAELLGAAYNGQIGTLFVAKGAQQWGQYSADSRQFTRHEEQQSDSENLIERLVSQAILTDATVYYLDADEVPGQAKAAATLRFPIMQPEMVTA